MNVKLILFFCFIVTSFLFAKPVFAQQRAAIVVDSSADTTANDGKCTLREAIANANHDDQSGSTDCAAGNGTDTITFSASLNGATITLLNGELTIDDQLVINGLGETRLTISGNNSSRIFYVTTGFSFTVTDMIIEAGKISDVAFALGGCIGLNDIANNSAPIIVENVTLRQCLATSPTGLARGGAISARNLTLTNVTLHDNQAIGEEANGGAIHTQGRVSNRADVTFDDVTAYNNLAQGTDSGGAGGAIYFLYSTVNWTTGNLYQNSATTIGDGSSFGGAITNQATTLVVEDVTLHQNDVGGSGGAISHIGGGATVGAGGIIGNNITITENTAVSGAGISTVGGLQLTNSLVQENVASDPSKQENSSGGGLAVNRASDLVLTNTQIISNSADFGGGISWYHGVTCSGGTLSGAVIQGNVANFTGGGIYATPESRCPMSIEDTTIHANRAEDGFGAGIYNGRQSPFLGLDEGELSIRSTTITDNVAAGGGSGGGIANTSILIVEDGVTIRGNSAGGGGGIFSQHTLFVDGATISQNSATTGGGISNITDGPTQNGFATITNVTLDDNSAVLSGGGIASFGTMTNSLTITQSTISNNSAGFFGGGVYYSGGVDSDIANSTISGNNANNSASGVYVASGGLRLTNATVAFGTGNIGVVRAGGTLTLRNSIVALNGGDECSGTITTLGSPNLATDATCGASIVNGNPLLQLLQNNGGGTATHLPLSTSPAVDAGNDFVCLSPIVGLLDQRGYRRPAGAHCDLGAVEFDGGVPTAVTVKGISAENTPSLLRMILPTLALICIIGVLWLLRTRQGLSAPAITWRMCLLLCPWIYVVKIGRI